MTTDQGQPCACHPGQPCLAHYAEISAQERRAIVLALGLRPVDLPRGGRGDTTVYRRAWGESRRRSSGAMRSMQDEN